MGPGFRRDDGKEAPSRPRSEPGRTTARQPHRCHRVLCETFASSALKRFFSLPHRLTGEINARNDNPDRRRHRAALPEADHRRPTARPARKSRRHQPAGHFRAAARPDQWRHRGVDHRHRRRQLGRLPNLAVARRHDLRVCRHDLPRRPPGRLDRRLAEPCRPRHRRHAVGRSDREPRPAAVRHHRRCRCLRHLVLLRRRIDLVPDRDSHRRLQIQSHLSAARRVRHPDRRAFRAPISRASARTTRPCSNTSTRRALSARPSTSNCRPSTSSARPCRGSPG